MNQHAHAEEYDDERHAPSFLARIKANIFGHEEDEDDEEETPSAAPSAPLGPSEPSRASGGSSVPLKRSGTTLRLDHARQTQVTVRRSMRVYEDARPAADGLKEGQQQIVNLEQTPVEVAERIINFLSGAAYALDGGVERIGDQVYLFTPASVSVEGDKPAAPARASSVFNDHTGLRSDGL